MSAEGYREVAELNRKTVDELYAVAEEGLANHLDNAHDSDDAEERGRSQGQKDAWRTVLRLIGLRGGVSGIHSNGCPLCGKGALEF
jgi:hypothetical protein